MQILSRILYSVLFILLCFVNQGYSQTEESWMNEDGGFEDTLSTDRLLTLDEINEYIKSLPHGDADKIIGGYVSSIFYESIDSAKIEVVIDGKYTSVAYSNNGLFSYACTLGGKVLDLHISHPDFHPFDTTILLNSTTFHVMHIVLEPKFKILLRGRVFAGNMPLEGVDVEIKHAGVSNKFKTLGCYYDSENYWNCLYDGMFKADLTTDNPDDSILLLLHKEGMKPLRYGLVFNEYTGEVMQLKMKYEGVLPMIPLNNLSLKLGFPFTSIESDWFVSLSYYRSINTHILRRLALGVEGNMYISNIAVTHTTFPGLEPSSADSSYIIGFIGPSALIWIIPPEIRYFSTYAGITIAKGINSTAFAYQPFIGTRMFLDMNKAISVEVRYTEFDQEIVHYIFNPYGNAYRYTEKERLVKLHANIGVQITF